MSETIETKKQVVPTWFVSARNGRRTASSQGRTWQWRPFGLHHARQVGRPVTACGVLAAEWQLFWDMPFPAEPGSTCPDCRRVVELSLVKDTNQLSSRKV